MKFKSKIQNFSVGFRSSFGRMRLAILLILLSISTLNQANEPSLNVELDPEQYQQAIEDFKQIFSQPGSANNNGTLTFLRKESVPEIARTHYFPKGKNQGKLSIKNQAQKDVITILQVPHAFFDIHSQEIAQQMFDTPWVDVLMVNTLHRYETEHSDLSRLRYSLFTAVVEALQQLKRQVKFIQVHGFNENKRDTLSARNADIILSNGSVETDTYMLQLQSCLRDNTQLLARAYGRDVFELGATINPIGKLIKDYNKTLGEQNTRFASTDNLSVSSAPSIHFLHIEISRAIRNAMIQGPGITSDTNATNNGNAEVLKCLLNH